MKKRLFALFLCAAIIGQFAGCKKSEPGGSTPSSPGKPTAQRAPGDSTEAVELKMKWPVGTRYMYRTEIDQNMEFKMPNMPKPMQQQMTMAQNYSLAVLKETPDAGREIEFEFVSMEMDMRMGERTMMSFDSKGESTGEVPGTDAFRKMIGAKLKFLLNSTNHLEKIEGYEELMNKLPGGGGMARQIYGEHFFKQMMDVGKGLPDKPVKVGDTWPAQIDVAMGPLGNMILDLNYTFRNWEDRDQHKCAVLQFTGTIRQKPGDSGPKPMGNFSIENGKFAGKNWFDPDLGAMISSDIDGSMAMKMPDQGPGAPRQQGPQSIDITQKIKINLVELSKTSGGGG